METYEIKFEFFGKYMMTKVKARNEEEAKRKVTERINFISCVTDKDDEVVDMLKNIFGIK